MSIKHHQNSRFSSLHQINYWLILFIIIWAPIPLGSNRDWSASLLILLISISGFIWSVERLKAPIKALEISSNGIKLLVILLIPQIWAITQRWLLEAQDPDQNMQYILLGFAYSALFLLIMSYFNNRNDLNRLVIVLIISGVVQAFIGAATSLNLIPPLFSEINTTSSASGTFVNRNHFAGYLVMTISLSIGLLLALRDSRDWSWKNFIELLLSHKMMIRLALVIMVIGLVMSHSRMGNAAFVIALSAVGAVFILKNARNRIRNVLILLSFIIIDVMIISQFFGLEKLKDRLSQTEIAVTQEQGKLLIDINDLRSPINAQGIKLIQQSPIIGQGAGGFETAFSPYAGPNFGGRIDHAHNDYLEFWIEYGLIGTIPLAIFIIMALWLALKSLRNSSSNYRSGLGFGVAMALIGILIHSASDFNLHIPSNALTLIVICAIAVLIHTHKRPKRKNRNS